jgi:hypothetical protein
MPDLNIKQPVPGGRRTCKMHMSPGAHNEGGEQPEPQIEIQKPLGRDLFKNSGLILPIEEVRRGNRRVCRAVLEMLLRP